MAIVHILLLLYTITFNAFDITVRPRLGATLTEQHIKTGNRQR